MAQRVYLSGNPPRLITSKPGQNASPSLPDAQKTFDSDWFYGGGIKFQLTANSLTDTQVNFPYALNYIPSVVALMIVDMDKQQMSGMWGGISSIPPPPSNAKGIFLLTGRYDISTSSIYGLSLETNPSFNYIHRFWVFEG